LIEVRKLTRQEFNQLIKEAPDSETSNLKRLLGNGAYDYFDKNALEQSGLVINERPIYFGVLTLNKDRVVEIWTVVNSNVREQFTLYKLAKRMAYLWVEKYKVIYATMEKVNLKNIEWTQRMGFKVVQENDNFITLKLGGL